ncbi:DMT family transporter [Salinibacterium sp. G-O1]|uniref:DMT family transporter n=1 Tax=Salinibacterium sp. G-O1 TaxID=3046208 RepID=UPI0024BB4905|nr:DMT family transporter [Salinibacterium sp. G-O1]MDJ0333837.1 DMT family transporter [Salinibacterium sp. G-O1]
MLTVIIGLSSALVYGAADFLGGLAAKRMSAVLVTAIVALAGLVVLLIGLPFFGGNWSVPAVLLGAASGVTGAIAIGLLYACLAVGPMSILSPLTAVVSAIVPVTVGLIGGDRLGTLGYVALGLAFVAIIMVGFVPEKGAVRPSLKAVLMAVGSGAAIGAFLIIIDAAPDDSGLVPLVVNRTVNATIMFSIVAVMVIVARRRDIGSPLGSWRGGLTLAVACGVIDATANVGLLIGLRIGDLSVMAVLTALYPAGTIILAAIVLKERIAPVQYAGLAVAVTAGAMLALS